MLPDPPRNREYVQHINVQDHEIDMAHHDMTYHNME